MHLAALEHFLKNDERGQEILQSLEEGHEEKEAVETKVTWVANLDRILSPKSDRAYELSALWVRWKQEPIISCGRLESGKSIAKNTTLFGIFRFF